MYAEMGLKPEDYKRLQQALEPTTVREDGVPDWWTDDDEAAEASMAAAKQFAAL